MLWAKAAAGTFVFAQSHETVKAKGHAERFVIFFASSPATFHLFHYGIALIAGKIP